MSDKLKRIIELSKCEVGVRVNAHKCNYESAAEGIDNLKCLGVIDSDITTNEVIVKMIELDTIVEVYSYADTPIAQYSVIHYDLDSALDIILNTLEGKRI